MAGERSVAVFIQAHESQQKFDYFVTGLTGALCGFIAERYTASRLGVNASTLELVSICILLVSFWFGFRRLQFGTLINQLNAHMLDVLEKRGTLATSVEGAPVANASTGDIYLPEMVRALVRKYGKDAKDIEKALEDTNSSAETAYHWRNRCLVAGFVVLLVAKVLRAYL